MPRIQRQDVSSLPIFKDQIEEQEKAANEATESYQTRRDKRLAKLRNTDIKITVLVLFGAAGGILGGGAMVYIGMSPMAWAVIGPGIGLSAVGAGVALAPFKILYDYKKEKKNRDLDISHYRNGKDGEIDTYKSEPITLDDLYAAMNDKEATEEICTEFLGNLEQPEEMTEEEHPLYFIDIVKEIISWDFSASALEESPPNEKLFAAITSHPDKLKLCIDEIDNVNFIAAVIDKTEDDDLKEAFRQKLLQKTTEEITIVLSTKNIQISDELKQALIEHLLTKEITEETANVLAKHPQILAKTAVSQTLVSEELVQIFKAMRSREKIAFLNGVLNSNNDDFIEYVWETILKHYNEAERVPAPSVCKILAKRMDLVVKWSSENLLAEMVSKIDPETYPQLVEELLTMKMYEVSEGNVPKLELNPLLGYESENEKPASSSRPMEENGSEERKAKGILSLFAQFNDERPLPQALKDVVFDSPKKLERVLQEIEAEDARMEKRYEFFMEMSIEQRTAYFTYLNKKQTLLPLIERLLESDDLTLNEFELIGKYPETIRTYLNAGMSPSVDKVYRLLVNLFSMQNERREIIAILNSDVFKDLIKHIDQLRKNSFVTSNRFIESKREFITELLSTRKDTEKLLAEVFDDLSNEFVNDLIDLEIPTVNGFLKDALNKREELAQKKIAEQRKIEEDKRAYESEMEAIRKMKKADIGQADMKKYFKYLQETWKKERKLTETIVNDPIFTIAITSPSHYFNNAISPDISVDFLFAILERMGVESGRLITALGDDNYKKLLEALISKANATTADTIPQSLKIVIGFFRFDERCVDSYTPAKDTFSQCANEIKDAIITPSEVVTKGNKESSSPKKDETEKSKPQKEDTLDVLKKKLGSFSFFK